MEEQASKKSKTTSSTGFDYYLESLQKNSTEEAKTSEGQSITDLLHFLLRTGSVFVSELPSLSGIPYTSTIQLIPKLLELDFAVVKGSPGIETMELTATGEAVAKIQNLTDVA